VSYSSNNAAATVTLGVPQTCLAMKQATRSRCTSSHRLHSLIGFGAQTVKPPTFGFEAQTKKSSSRFWGPNHQTVAVVLRPNHQTINLGFEAQTKKPSQWFWGQTTNKPSPLVLRLNWETRASRLLLMYDTDHTRCHLTSRSSGHQVPNLWLIISDPPHQVSDSYLDPHCCPPCHIRHLHIMRQAIMYLHT
jgi:hypothetical protein